MKHKEQDSRVSLLGEYLRHRRPSPDEERLALDRVWKDLRLKEDRIPEDVPGGFRLESPLPIGRWPAWAAGAAVVVFAVVLSVVFWSRNAPARVETVDGGLYRVVEGRPQPLRVNERLEMGEVIHSNSGSGGTIVLADGSRVEMRTKSDLFLERADDGVRIHLNNGGIIVNAAKQHNGHLYVQTKDVTVSVVGTVFLVNAETEGSRVAVIEGEVRVQQQGAPEKKLGPGEQVTSNPKMESLAVKEELAWSRQAVAHTALLQQATTSPATQTPKEERLAFETDSIRPPAPKPAPGLGARGGGGNQRVNCHPVEAQLDPRRLSLNDVSLYELIGWAYGRCEDDIARFNYLSGGSAWIKSDRWDIEALIPEGSVNPLPTGFNGPVYELFEGRSPKIQKMLRTFVEERFKVAVRREMKEMPVYVLTVAPGGTKFQNIPPSPTVNANGRPVRFGFIGADGNLATPEQGAEAIRINGAARCNGNPCGTAVFYNQFIAASTSVLSVLAGRPVLDRTNIEGKVSFQIEWPRVPTPFVEGQIPPGPSLQELSKALEAAGLQLKDDPKGLVETWVIERAEKPSEN